MRRHVLTLAASLLAAGALSAPDPTLQAAAASASAQPAGPVFPGKLELVTVDVVVTDKQGRPITALGREDFTILEDGRPQTIASFEAVQVPAPAPQGAPAPRPVVSTNLVPNSRTSRSFVIVFDDNHLSPLNAQRAKAAVASFLDRVAEGDHVSLIATAGGTWWSTRMSAGREDLLAILKGLDGRRIRDSGHDRLSDYEAMRIHLFQDTIVGNRVLRRFQSLGLNIPDLRSRTMQEREERERMMLPGVNDMLVESRAAEAYRQVRARGQVTLSAVERALLALGPAQGRKSVILVSEGFVMDTTLAELKRVTEASRRVNAAIYFLDTRGLQGLSSAFSAEFGAPIDERDMGAALADTTQDSAGAEGLAADTGGFAIRNTNDLTSGVDRITSEARSYYLLGYQPPETPRDGRFRKIEVKVARRGAAVRARKGYYAPLDAPAAATSTPADRPDRDIQEALDAPFPVDQIPLRLTAYVLSEALLGRARVLIAADVDVASLGLESADGGLSDTLDVLLVAAQRETGEFFRADQKVELALRPETVARFRRTWYSFLRDFELASGTYQAKIVVRSRGARRLGTVTHEFSVPPLDQWRVSTPILTDTLEQHGRSGFSPVLGARRSFAAGGALYCQFDVFGAGKDPRTGMPRVSAGYSLVRPDGTVERHGAPTPIEPTSIGRVSRLLAIGLGGLGPGDYQLVLTVRDEVMGAAQELREPFRLIGPEQATH